MQIHVKNYFPLDDMPQIFGLHKSATSKATTDLAQDIMARTYKHQFVVKRPANKGMLVDKFDKHTQVVFEHYRQKLIQLQHEVPDEIPEGAYEV